MARPSKFNDALKETILRLYKEGKTNEQVAEIIGVSSRTLTNWKGKDPSFLLAAKEMKFIADELVEASIFHRATGYSHPEEKIVVIDDKIKKVRTTKHYPPDTAAGKYWLGNRQPEKWRERYQFDINDLDKKTDEELDQRINELIEKRKKEKK